MDYFTYINIPETRPVFLIYSDSKDLITSLQIYYPVESEPQSPDELVTITFYHGILDLSGKTIFCNTLIFAVRATLRFIHTQLRARGSEHILLHGTALKFRKKGVLFLAGTKTGKTTFSLYALSHYNCKYICDDLLIVNMHTLCVRRYTRPLLLREKGMPSLANEDQYAYTSNLCRYAIYPNQMCDEKWIPFESVVQLNRTNLAPSGINDSTEQILAMNLYNTGTMLENLNKITKQSSRLHFYRVFYNECSEIIPLLQKRSIII